MDLRDGQTARAEATPLVVDGVMYVSSAWSVVYALDAKTGEELWVYDPQVSGEDAAKGCCDVVNRGVAVHNGKVFVGVFDGRLKRLDAATGPWFGAQSRRSKQALHDHRCASGLQG
ncbi:MAG: hypothetical protein CM15mP84_03510 [Cellvibrionales bacterium]|nr:MAG: hypothetical protein CM15mP84_03510 [Cellvibrionales bacterium]